MRPGVVSGLEEGGGVKVLFLDIDGVLNSHRSCIALGGYVAKRGTVTPTLSGLVERWNDGANEKPESDGRA